MSVDFDVVDALAGLAEDLRGEGDFVARIHDAVEKLKKERDEARAEVELEREASAKLREEYGTALRETAERQREACAKMLGEWGDLEEWAIDNGRRYMMDAAKGRILSTPLVTEVKP